MSYREPGVIVTYTPTPGGEILPGSIRVPAFVGTGAVTHTIHAARFLASGTASDAIPFSIAAQSNIVAIWSIAGTEANPNYLVTVNYTFVTPYALTWVTTPPAAGTAIFVTYTAAKVAADYLPKIFSNIDDVVSEYGPLTRSGVSVPAILTAESSLTMAAQLAFKNGAQQVILAQTPATPAYTDYAASFAELESSIDGYDANVVVGLFDPLTYATGTGSNFYKGILALQYHIDTMNNPIIGKERMGYVAIGGGAPTTAIADEIALSAALADQLLCLVDPPFGYITANILVSAVETSVSDIYLDGNFVAAACAGLACRNDAAEPLTRKQIYGFDSLGVQRTKTDMDTLGAASVFVLQQNAGIIRVRQAVTTNPATVNTQEPTVQTIKMQIIKDMREGLASYIGRKLDAGIPHSIISTVGNLLKLEIEADIIVKYGSISAIQDSLDPRKVDVSFSILPIYPLNWIDVNFTIDLGLMA